MSTQPELFDVCSGKHGGNAQSKAANLTVDKAASRQAVILALRILGPMTCKEIASFLDKPMHAISGRITELKAMGMVKATDKVRDGGKVVKLA